MAYLGGYQYLACGYSSQGYQFCFAAALELSSMQLDAEEEGLISKGWTLKILEKMILSGEIKDATTVNTYGIAKLKGVDWMS